MKSVLVVDDEQALVLAIEIALERAGYKVCTAFTGEEALMAAKDLKPDLILMDVMMPGLDGLETLDVLKSHPDLKRIPVVMMSGARPLSRANNSWDDFVFKPLLVDDLLEVIKRHI